LVSLNLLAEKGGKRVSRLGSRKAKHGLKTGSGNVLGGGEGGSRRKSK